MADSDGGRTSSHDHACLGFRPFGLWLMVVGGASIVIPLVVGCGPLNLSTDEIEEDADSVGLLQADGSLRLQEKQVETMGIAASPAISRKLSRHVMATAQVFSVSENGEALASARLSTADTEFLQERPAIAWWQGQTFTGNVQRATALAFSDEEDIDVVLELYDKDRRLAPGMFLKAAIDLGSHDVAVCVPASAVLSAALGDFAYVVAGSGFRRKQVVTGIADPPWVEITEGLRAGQVIVTNGAEALWLLELSEVGGMTKLE